MKLLTWLEKTLDSRLSAIFTGPNPQPGSSEAIELYRAALDQISARASIGKRGDRQFPFNQIHIELQASAPDRRALLEALFIPAAIADDVRATLVEAGVKSPRHPVPKLQFGHENESYGMYP